MKKLKVLCPQEYAGIEMRVTTCDRCSTGWDAYESEETGSETE